MLDRIALKRDELIRDKKLNKDLPVNYYDGILDMWNETVKIMEETYGFKGKRVPKPKGNTVGKKSSKDVRGKGGENK